MAKNYRKNERTLLEIIIVGFFNGLWQLLKLIFGKKGKRGLSNEDRKELLTRRLQIEGMLTDDINMLKQAVFEADKLVDHALKLSGFGGETFADRLRSAENSMDRATYDSLWRGHKVRNTLAHEHDASFSKEELKDAVYKLLRYLK